MSRMLTSKASSAPGVTAAAREAREKGLKRFPWECSIHGMVEYYTASKSCPHCTVDRKDKLHQREYNRSVQDLYPHTRLADGS